MTYRIRRGRCILSRWSCAFVALGLVLPGACTSRRPPGERIADELLAVLPVEPAIVEPGITERERELSEAPLPADAGDAVTAQIYRVLAHQTEFRFVPDLTASEALDRPSVRGASSLLDRAVALGKEVGAAGVIFGRVFRFRERVGTELGATRPASVSLELSLVSVPTGEVIWHGQFDRTQEPLTSNLFNIWMFWRAGPRWFTAHELAGLGVERLFEDMVRVVGS